MESALFYANCVHPVTSLPEVKHMVSRVEYLKVMAGLITTAFAFIAGLAWNQAIQSIFIYFLGTPNSIPGNLAYAIIITIVAVIATVYIAGAARSGGRRDRSGSEVGAHNHHFFSFFASPQQSHACFSLSPSPST